MATSSGPWDETDDSASYDAPAAKSRPPRRSTLRVSHLHQPYPRPPSPLRHASRTAAPKSRLGGVVADKVDDLAASLQATTEVLSTADRMLEHYRDINVEQDEEIAKVCVTYSLCIYIENNTVLGCARVWNFYLSFQLDILLVSAAKT